nr:MAG: nitrile hydratase subunit alpha [Hyphomicrobiales bacterium]
MTSNTESHEDTHGHGAKDAHTHAPPAKDETIHSYYQLLGLALKELLIEKEIVTGEEIRRAIEGRDAITPALGAKVVARAWVDPAYKERLLANGHDAVKELGIEPGALNLSVVENTPRVHNVVVCTLCSCYPRNVLGLPPSWYKSREYRSRVVREPRTVLAEFGTTLSDDVEVVVHDSTADLRYLVLPMRPQGTENMNEEDLAALISRDCMIGVSVVKN